MNEPVTPAALWRLMQAERVAYSLGYYAHALSFQAQIGEALAPTPELARMVARGWARRNGRRCDD